MSKPTFPPGYYGLRTLPADIRSGLRKIAVPNDSKTDVIIRALRRGLGLPDNPVLIDEADAARGGGQ